MEIGFNGHRGPHLPPRPCPPAPRANGIMQITMFNPEFSLGVG